MPFIPTRDPQLGSPVYEMIFGHLLLSDKAVRPVKVTLRSL